MGSGYNPDLDKVISRHDFEVDGEEYSVSWVSYNGSQPKLAINRHTGDNKTFSLLQRRLPFALACALPDAIKQSLTGLVDEVSKPLEEVVNE